MNNIIQDPLWQVIGVIIAIVGIVIVLILRHRRSLSCILLSAIPLSNTISNAHEQLKVVFRKQILKQPFLLAFRFVNTGNIPLKPDDFMTPISIDFSKQTKVITAELIEENPNNLNTQIKAGQNNVEIQPMLLNPKDNFILKLLLDQFDKEININARITGIRKIGKYPVSPLRALVLTFIFGISISLLAMLLFTVWFRVVPLGKMVGLSAMFIIYGIFHTIIHLERYAREISNPRRLR